MHPLSGLCIRSSIGKRTTSPRSMNGANQASTD
jgi:hypothetical protein